MVKSFSLFGIRVLVFGMGLLFPFMALMWKIIFLVAYFIFRLVDIDRDGKYLGAHALFIIGLILSYTYKLIFE